MAALIDAIDVKRKMYFEFENAPYYCLDVEVSTPTARGGQTLVRLKMRNLLTRVPKSLQSLVATLVRSTFAQPAAQSVRAQVAARPARAHHRAARAEFP